MSAGSVCSQFEMDTNLVAKSYRNFNVGLWHSRPAVQNRTLRH